MDTRINIKTRRNCTVMWSRISQWNWSHYHDRKV